MCVPVLQVWLHGHCAAGGRFPPSHQGAACRAPLPSCACLGCMSAAAHRITGAGLGHAVLPCRAVPASFAWLTLRTLHHNKQLVLGLLFVFSTSPCLKWLAVPQELVLGMLYNSLQGALDRNADVVSQLRLDYQPGAALSALLACNSSTKSPIVSTDCTACTGCTAVPCTWRASCSSSQAAADPAVSRLNTATSCCRAAPQGCTTPASGSPAVTVHAGYASEHSITITSVPSTIEEGKPAEVAISMPGASCMMKASHFAYARRMPSTVSRGDRRVRQVGRLPACLAWQWSST